MVTRSAVLRALTFVTAMAAAGFGRGFAQGQAPGPRQPARDTSARQQDPNEKATAAIAGRVLAADTGRPVKRARVFVSGAELPGGRGILTEDDGTFAIVELPAGRYTLTV